MTPKLASVLTPRDLMGRRAAEVLLARLRGELPPQQIVDVGFELLPERVFNGSRPFLK